MNKVHANAAEALKGFLRDDITIAAGGFGLCGIPENLIQAVVDSGIKGLTIVGNNAGVDDFGMGLLLKTHQVRKVIASYVGENKEFERQFLSGELEVELVPQGTLAERLRAAGAGIEGFYTRTGVGTQVAEGKEVRTFDGRDYLLERPLRGDFALVHAWKADTHGNLVFRKAARNFNPLVATAAALTIAEAEEVVPAGALDPDQIHLPGIYVKRLVRGQGYQKWIERRTVRPRAGEGR